MNRPLVAGQGVDGELDPPVDRLIEDHLDRPRLPVREDEQLVERDVVESSRAEPIGVHDRGSGHCEMQCCRLDDRAEQASPLDTGWTCGEHGLIDVPSDRRRRQPPVEQWMDRGPGDRASALRTLGFIEPAPKVADGRKRTLQRLARVLGLTRHHRPAPAVPPGTDRSISIRQTAATDGRRLSRGLLVIATRACSPS